MRRKKRSVFPFLLFLCFILILLIGIKQHLEIKDTTVSLPAVLDQFLSGETKDLSSSEPGFSPAEESIDSHAASVTGNASVIDS